MAASQSHRGGAQPPASGTRNRGFVSSDPERQSEQVSTGRAVRPTVQPADSFRFALRRPPGAVRAVRKQGAPEPDAQAAHEAPQGKGGKRRGGR